MTIAVALLALRFSAESVPTSPEPQIPLGPFVRAKNGDLLAVNDGWVRRSKDGGGTWQGARMFPGGGSEPLNDSALLVTSSGRVLCYFIDRQGLRFAWDRGAGAPSADTRSRSYVAYSDDHGATWKQGSPLPATYVGATRGLVEVAPGRLFAIGQDITRAMPRHVTVFYESRDNGTTWRRAQVADIGGRGDHDGIYEGVAVASGSGKAVAVLRTNNDALYVSRFDGSRWGTPATMRVASSSSPAGLVRLASGEIVMVYNPLFRTGQRSGPRTAGDASERAASWYRRELYARWSKDGGRSWSEPRLLYTANTDVAYPTVFEIEPGVLWVTTYQGQARFRFLADDLFATPPVR